MFSDTSISELKCETCVLAKSDRANYPLSFNKSTVLFTLIHTDVWGPSLKPSMHGYRWYVIFVDDYTRMTWLYLLKHKDEVFNIFQSFYTMICTQYSTKPRVLRSDNGSDYVNAWFREFFHHHGMIRETSCPQTPQQNGVVEWKNRHILETARALLIGANMPKQYWANAVMTTIYVICRMPSRVLEMQTPLHVLSIIGALPPVLMMQSHVFGCVAYVHL